MQLMKDKEKQLYRFEKFRKENLVLLFEWMQQPYVERWSGAAGSFGFFERKYKDLCSQEDGSFLIYLSGIPLGFLRYYYTDRIGDGWWAKSDPCVLDTVRMIIIIGRPSYLGMGHGAMIINMFAHKLFCERPSLKRILIGPNHKNIAAVKSYEKAGFRKIREEETEEGRVQLMEYLRS
ncbi:GNAT family N-acetyltransferase [Candidatus Dependentiae bacterium]